MLIIKFINNIATICATVFHVIHLYLTLNLFLYVLNIDLVDYKLESVNAGH